MRRKWLLLGAALAALVVGVGAGIAAGGGGSSTIMYDDFSTDNASKWAMPYGPLEAGVNDADHYRRVSHGAEHMRAVPFTQSADYSVFDHLKMMETSTQSFPLPATGSVQFSADITASTPGIVNSLKQLGIYGPPGTWTDPQNPPKTPDYSAKLMEGQQAGVVLNMIDFCSGQLFDWFLSSNKAFTLIERLPSNVTNNTANCPGSEYVGRDLMYTQIADEVPLTPGKHSVAIKVTQTSSDLSVEYTLDGKVVTSISHVGIPLDKQQRVHWSGTYPSLGPGEELRGKISSFAIGHGLFSLLDAFPFQHPEAPELSVSIPTGTGNPADAGRARLYGQGADGAYDNFRVTTSG